MGHDAFVERYNRPNYKLHIIIFISIVGMSVFLSTQVEKTKENTDVAALKNPVPIDSIGLDDNARQNTVPVIKPPVAQTGQQTTTINESELVQEYAFEQTPDLAAINQLLDGDSNDNQADEFETSKLAISVVKEPEDADSQPSKIAENTVDNSSQKVVKLDEVYQQQQDRFLQTLAKSAELDSEESIEIKRIKEAIRNDKPLTTESPIKKTVIAKNTVTKSTTTKNTETTKQKSKLLSNKDNTVNLQQTRNPGNVQKTADLVMATAQTASIRTPVRSETILTKSELDKILNQFTHYYNQGDINRLMALFAKNASTNDQKNKLGIKNDYHELFTNTQARNLKINNMQWNLGKGTAEGEAIFTVTVQPKNSAEKARYRGHLKIIAVKDPKGVYITRLLHEIKSQ